MCIFTISAALYGLETTHTSQPRLQGEDHQGRVTRLSPTCVHVQLSCKVVSNSLRPYRLQSARLLYPRNFPGKNAGWVVLSSSKRTSQPRDQTRVPVSLALAGRFSATEPTLSPTPLVKSLPWRQFLQRCQLHGLYPCKHLYIHLILTAINKYLHKAHSRCEGPTLRAARLPDIRLRQTLQRCFWKST